MKLSPANLTRSARWCGVVCGLAILCRLADSWAAEISPAKQGDDLFARGVIRRIQIELKPGSIASLRTNAREFVSCNVSDGGSVYSEVAIRLKGAMGSFRPLDDKPSLTLDFGRFQTGRKFHGLRRIHLNNSVEDPSYTNEKLASELFQAAGVPSPRVTRALVGLNGRALGLYVLKEGFTEDFLALHFQKVSGELYEPGDGHDVNEKLERNSVEAPYDSERTALKNLAAAVLETDPAQRWQKLEATLDTKRFITFMAMEVMLGHRDGYCIMRNNFRVYHDLEGDRIVFFPSGMDQLFGTADLPWQPHLAGVVARSVMDTPEGKQVYTGIFWLMLTNLFNVGQLTNRVDQLVEELRPALSTREFAEVKTEADAVKERIAQRKLSLLAQRDQPAAKPMEFVAGVGYPRGWEAAVHLPHVTVDRAHVEGVATLHIGTTSEASASWRVSIVVPRGRYRFEGRARVAGVKPLPFGTHQGARLRVADAATKEAPYIGDTQWSKLLVGFDVSELERKVELVCELRARAGEAWFDLDSLRVVRIGDL